VPKKAKAKSGKILKFQKPKISKNITLDRLSNGELIKSIEHYKTRDLERMFTIDDVLLLIPKDLKKRTWANWRELNNEPGILREDKLGPEYVIRGKKIYRIKLIWILRYLKGLCWEPLTQVQVSATQSDEIQLRSSTSI
jgi:hypothetical protein